MKYLLRQVTVLDQNSKHHNQKVDICVQEGKIKAIKSRIEEVEAEEITIPGAYVSVGWMDIGVQGCDPGFEYREDLSTVTNAASAGGFTALAFFPNTQPVVHSKSEVMYLKGRLAHSIIDGYPIGAVSVDNQGKDITEMYDMYHAGAIAFSDGEHPVQDGGLMMRALQYVKGIQSLIINRPFLHSIAPEGQIHEGLTSTMLGMPGIPNIAEELIIQRDLQLLKYTDSRLHIYGISTRSSVEYLRAAKKDGLNVTASTPLLNLLFSDEDLISFNTHLKVLPPLRSEMDQRALFEGLEDGTIDCITTNHIPQIDDEKKLEFPYASFGASGLQTALAGSLLCSNRIPIEKLIQIWTVAPRKLLNLTVPTIQIGEPANLTLFHPNLEWKVDPKTLFSKSKNSPFIGQTLQGKVLAVLNKGIFHSYIED